MYIVQLYRALHNYIRKKKGQISTFLAKDVNFLEAKSSTDSRLSELAEGEPPQVKLSEILN